MTRPILTLATLASLCAFACSAPPPPEEPDEVPTTEAPAAPPVVDQDVAGEPMVAAPAPTSPAAPESVGTAPAGSLLDRMPSRCARGRVYVQVEKVLPGDSAASISKLLDDGFKKNKGKTRADDVFAALKAGGVDPVKQLKELAVCADDTADDALVAITLDMSKVKDPAATLSKAIKVGDGEAPKSETVGDVTYLSSQKGKDVLAIVGKSTLIIGKSREMVAAAAAGGTKGVGFGDAGSYAAWIDFPESSVRGTVKESGEDFVLDATVVNAALVRQKEEISAKLSAIETNVGKLPAVLQTVVRPLLPALKNAKISSEADALKVTTTFPKKTIPDVLGAAKKLKPEDLEKAVRF